MYRARALSRLLLGAANIGSRSLACEAAAPTQGCAAAARALANCLSAQKSQFHTSWTAWAEAPTKAPGSEAVSAEEAVAHLMDKDEWDEAWAYTPYFGTAENPVAVPSLLDERIMGVTDPEDDTLVIWGILRANEPPKQLVAGGEFFVLKKVARIPRVRDVLIEAGHTLDEY